MTLYRRQIVAQMFSRPWRMFFVCGKPLVAKKLAKKTKETDFLQGKWYCILFFWALANSLLMASERWNNKNRLFFRRSISDFFAMSFVEIFSRFCEVFGTSSRNVFFHQLYLWAQERYRYIFVVYLVASAEKIIFQNIWPNLFDCRKTGKKN